MNRNNPILYIVIPCYNEEKVLPTRIQYLLKRLSL